MSRATHVSRKIFFALHDKSESFSGIHDAAINHAGPRLNARPSHDVRDLSEGGRGRGDNYARANNVTCYYKLKFNGSGSVGTPYASANTRRYGKRVKHKRTCNILHEYNLKTSVRRVSDVQSCFKSNERPY